MSLSFSIAVAKISKAPAIATKERMLTPEVNVLRASPNDPIVSATLSPTSPNEFLIKSNSDSLGISFLPENMSKIPLKFLNSLKKPIPARAVPIAPTAFTNPSKDMLDTNSLIPSNIGFILSHAPDITDLTFSNAVLSASVTGGIFLIALNNPSRLGMLSFTPLTKPISASPTNTRLLSRLDGIRSTRYLATSPRTPSPILIPENNKVKASSNNLVARSDSLNLEVRFSIALANLKISSASSTPNTLVQALPTASNILENGCNTFLTILPITPLPPSFTNPSAKVCSLFMIPSITPDIAPPTAVHSLVASSKSPINVRNI